MTKLFRWAVVVAIVLAPATCSAPWHTRTWRTTVPPRTCSRATTSRARARVARRSPATPSVDRSPALFLWQHFRGRDQQVRPRRRFDG